MKKILSFILLVTTMMLNTSVFADDIYIEDESLEAPEISAESAILLDLKSGRVIYSKNPDEQVFPASTTKILTGIIALENADLQESVTAPAVALAPIQKDESHMGIVIDEVFTMEQLINGMMVESANDAANVIASHLGGTPEHFVEIMNEKAKELGAVGTNFVNAYGIHDENHYTTASDLALIAYYAMQNEQFREIVKKDTYSIPATNKNPERELLSTNLFMSEKRSTKYLDKRVTGIKTGHTSKAGYCLVSSAVVDDTELMAVVMNCPNQESLYTTTSNLLDFGFDNYEYRTIVKSGEIVTDSKVIEAKDDKRVAFTVQNDISALLPKDAEISSVVETVVDLAPKIKAPITKGDSKGSVSYNYNGTLVGHGTLIAANDVERNVILFIFNLIVGILTFPFFYIPVILLIIFFIFMRFHTRKQEQLKRKRRLHEKRSDRVMRNGTKNPINPRYEDTSKRRNPNSRYRK